MERARKCRNASDAASSFGVHDSPRGSERTRTSHNQLTIHNWGKGNQASLSRRKYNVRIKVQALAGRYGIAEGTCVEVHAGVHWDVVYKLKGSKYPSTLDGSGARPQVDLSCLDQGWMKRKKTS